MRHSLQGSIRSTLFPSKNSTGRSLEWPRTWSPVGYSPRVLFYHILLTARLSPRARRKRKWGIRRRQVHRRPRRLESGNHMLLRLLNLHRQRLHLQSSNRNKIWQSEAVCELFLRPLDRYQGPRRQITLLLRQKRRRRSNLPRKGRLPSRMSQ